MGEDEDFQPGGREEGLGEENCKKYRIWGRVARGRGRLGRARCHLCPSTPGARCDPLAYGKLKRLTSENTWKVCCRHACAHKLLLLLQTPSCAGAEEMRAALPGLGLPPGL